MEDATPAPAPSYLVYDGDCPFCKEYVSFLRLRASVGRVELVSARSQHPVVDDLRDRGFDLNQGIAFVEQGVVYFGDGAVTRVASLTSPAGFLNRMTAAIFRHAGVSAVLYPVLKFGRRCTLWMLRRPPIDYSGRSERR
ncbi:MAG: DCC1-like thiol-disulfide oxidoreductase family protein [Pseudomonadota bacterium]